VVISSSVVRSALLSGDVARANRYLGHPYFLAGWVEHGQRTVHPTVTPGKCLPARGVYATWVKVQGQWCMGATNVGYGPTFGGSRLSVEVLLLDHEGEVDHAPVRVAFVKRLREERRYPDADALAAQIARDVEGARRHLQRVGEPGEI
jgi:riboflavin kinase/FMN adenylyltransferase